MYTLRTFKDVSKINRFQINLGNSYEVKGVDQSDEELGIKLRVFGDGVAIPEDGICIYSDDHAFIMTETGKTFETLNRPKKN